MEERQRRLLEADDSTMEPPARREKRNYKSKRFLLAGPAGQGWRQAESPAEGPLGPGKGGRQRGRRPLRGAPGGRGASYLP